MRDRLGLYCLLHRFTSDHLLLEEIATTLGFAAGLRLRTCRLLQLGQGGLRFAYGGLEVILVSSPRNAGVRSISGVKTSSPLVRESTASSNCPARSSSRGMQQGGGLARRSQDREPPGLRPEGDFQGIYILTYLDISNRIAST